MKKLNAVLSLITTTFLICHVVTEVLCFTMGVNLKMLTIILARATPMLLIIHGVLSLINLIVFHDGSDLGKYIKQNRNTMIQRVTGLITIVLMVPHVLLFKGFFSGAIAFPGAKILVSIVEVLFFNEVFMHIAISFPKALTSLGSIREDSTEKTVSKLAKVVYLLMMIFTCVRILPVIINWG